MNKVILKTKCGCTRMLDEYGDGRPEIYIPLRPDRVSVLDNPLLTSSPPSFSGRTFEFKGHKAGEYRIYEETRTD